MLRGFCWVGLGSSLRGWSQVGLGVQVFFFVGLVGWLGFGLSFGWGRFFWLDGFVGGIRFAVEFRLDLGLKVKSGFAGFCWMNGIWVGDGGYQLVRHRAALGWWDGWICWIG